MFDFLTLHPEAFGLDLSDLSLKIMKLKKAREGFRVASFGSFDIPQGILSQGEIVKEQELAEIIRSAMASVQGEKLNTNFVVASLPEEKAFLQVIQLPRMKEEEVAAAVTFESENYIPYPLETVYLDTQAVHPLSNHLEHLDALVASLPRSIVDSYVSLLERAGLIAQVLEIESLAAVRALVPFHSSPFPLLIVDCGATRTSFVVFAGTAVRFTVSIPISARQFTQAIATHLGCDLGKAEQLKKLHGFQKKKNGEGRKVFEALVGSATALAEQIKKYLDFYETHASHQHLTKEDRTIRKILLSGGGANLKGLDAFLSKELKTEVHIGNPWVNVFPPSKSRELPPLPLEASLAYSTALGLALRGIRSPHDLP